MPKPTYDTLEATKKRKLLEAAMKEFGTHGYEVASINRILEDAGFSKGSFYYYFDDKLDLAVTVFLVAAEPELNAKPFPQPESQADFWSTLRAVTMRRLQVLESKRLEYDCLIRLGNAVITQPELAARVMPHFGPMQQKTLDFFQRGVELGALRRDMPITTQMALVQAAKTAAYKAQFPGDLVPTDAEMEAFADLVLDLGRRICSPEGK